MSLVKKNIRKYIRNIISETIRASEAQNSNSAIKTVIEGKRNVAWINDLRDDIQDELRQMGFKTSKVPSNPYNAYVIFRPGFEKQAFELINIAEKYNGYLSHNASIDDTIRIGQLLEYDPIDIQTYVEKMIKNKQNHES